jgi:hypothetical protein
MAEDRSLLGKIADSHLGTLVHRETGDLLIIKEYLAGVRNDESGDHIEAGSLSCTVRSEKSYDLSLLDFHRHTLHDCSRAIFLD